MRARNRLTAVLTLSASLVLAACEEQTFQDPVVSELEIIDLDRVRLGGGQKLVVTGIQVTSEMVHPEIIGRWSNLEREIEVEVFFLRRADYDALGPDAHPSEYNMFWRSVPEEGVSFGDNIATTMHVHPCELVDSKVPDGACVPDEWVLFFYNPLPPARANEAKISGRVWLRWYE